MKRSNIIIGLVLSILVAFLVFPIFAVVLFSIAGVWLPGKPFPDTYTFHWYADTLRDPDVQMAILRSFAVAMITVIASLALVVQTTYIIRLKFPRLEALMRLSTLLPFVLPGVVLALGLTEIYSHPPFSISGTVTLLVLSYIAISLPLMYYSIANSMDAINSKVLTEAAQSLGASLPTTFLRVILPNVVPGIISGSLLTFAGILGEFTLANLLVGTSFKTLQIYLFIAINEEGHLTSALTIIYFVLVAIASFIVILLAHRVSHEQIVTTLH